MIGARLFSRAKEMWEKQQWRPLLLSVRPTMRCNARCVMCGNWKQPQGMIDFDVLQAAVQDAAGLGVMELRISGGEPLMYPRLLELIETASALGLDVDVNTNGYYLDRKQAEDFADAGVTQVFLSLDSPSEAVHDTIRVKQGCWQRACRASRNAADCGIRVILNTIVNKQTYKEIPELIRLRDDLGFDEVSLMYMIGYTQLFLTTEEILDYNENVVPRIEAAAADTGVKIRTTDAYIFGRTPRELAASARGDYAHGRIEPPCLVALFTLYITEKGDLFPCTESAYGNELHMGNIYEKPLPQLLSQHQDRSIQGTDRLYTACKHCKYEYITFNQLLKEME
jgi:radical SAM protein with 4Fe4S-binding SPASM domain